MAKTAAVRYSTYEGRRYVQGIIFAATSPSNTPTEKESKGFMFGAIYDHNNRYSRNTNLAVEMSLSSETPWRN
jgi:hypothetical protein